MSPIWSPGFLQCHLLLYSFPRTTVTKYHELNGLKKPKMYSLTVLEAQSPKSRCQQSCVPCEGSQEVSLPFPGYLFKWDFVSKTFFGLQGSILLLLVTITDVSCLWQHRSSLCLHFLMTVLCVCVSNFPLLGLGTQLLD